MSEPTYSIVISEAERTAMAKALGALVAKLINAPVVVESPSNGSAARANLSPPAVAPAPPSIEQRDRWARDRKGNELPNPEGCYPADVHIWKTVQSSEKYLKVTWQASSGQGYTDANCFDSKLWPWLIKSAGQRTRLYLATKGKYLNIVGVRA
jgi:hypothetical protein